MAKDEIVKFYGVKETIAQMRKFEPEMLKDLRKNIRQIAQPGVTEIKKLSPAVAPLSGMNHNGRSAYSRPKITIQVTPGARSGFGRTTANLVAIKAEGSGKVYGFEIADLAGRGGNAGKYRQTRPFVDSRTGQTVRRRINGQGENMVSVLNARSKKPPSRYVYGALENKLPQIRLEVGKVIDQTMNAFSRRLNK
jgi:hypothetical protein